MPVTSFAMISFTFATALVTPRPRKRSFSPSRSSHASCSPVLAPLGTMAVPVPPPASVTTASTVGLPRESMTWRPWTRTIFVMDITGVLLLKYQRPAGTCASSLWLWLRVQRCPRKKRLAGSECNEVCHSYTRDFRERLSCQESLMRRDQHVRKGKQAGQFVVMQDLSGQIFEENALLFFVHIESHAAEPTGFQCRDQRFSVDERAAADIDQDRAGLHQLERFATDDVVRLRRQRRVQRDHFALARQRPRVGVYHTMLLRPLVRGKQVESQHFHPKPTQTFRGHSPDSTPRENPGCLAV